MLQAVLWSNRGKMKLKLIAEILRGFSFHYYGNKDRVYTKLDNYRAVNPEGKVQKISKSTLVVPHEGKQGDK